MNNPSISNPPTSFPTLLPCPFCGQGSTYRCDHRGGEWSHDAPGCFLNGVYIAGSHSVEQWNTRPQLQSTEAVERALRNAREAVASLDEDALGEVVTSYNKHGEPDSGYPIRNELLAEIDAAITALTSPAVVEDPHADEVERLHERLAETQMLAFKWMEAHDKLAAGKPYKFPSPADLPDALAALLVTDKTGVEK